MWWLSSILVLMRRLWCLAVRRPCPGGEGGGAREAQADLLPAMRGVADTSIIYEFGHSWEAWRFVIRTPGKITVSKSYRTRAAAEVALLEEIG